MIVVSPHDPDGVELVLEPNDHPAARANQDALTADGIPITAVAVDDVRTSVTALEQRGVRVVQPAAEMGPFATAMIDDTCGNLLQLTSPVQ